MVGLKELNDFGCRIGGDIFTVLDVAALAFAQVINMRETELWETDWIVIS